MKLCPTEISHSQLWRPLLDYRWKTEGNNAPLEVFSSAKIVLLTTVLETSSIAEVISIDIESCKFTSVKGLSSNRRVFRMTSARF